MGFLWAARSSESTLEATSGSPKAAPSEWKTSARHLVQWSSATNPETALATRLVMRTVRTTPGSQMGWWMGST